MKKPVPRRGTHRGEAGLSFRWPGHFLLEINNTKSELRPLAITALAQSSGSRVNEEGGASGEVVFVVIRPGAGVISGASLCLSTLSPSAKFG